MDELVSGPQGLTSKELTVEQYMGSFFPGHCQEFIAIMRDLLNRCKSMSDLAITQIGVFGESLVDHLESEMHELESEVGEEVHYRDVHQNIVDLIASPQFILWNIAKNEHDRVRSALFLENPR